MAEAQRGTVAVAWGISSSITGSGLGTTMTVQQGTFAKESESVETKNGKGQTINKTLFNFKHTYSLTVTPTADTLQHAKDYNIMPKPGAIITVADTEDTEVSGTNGGKYLAVKATKSKDNAKPNDFVLELEQWVDLDVAVAPN